MAEGNGDIRLRRMDFNDAIQGSFETVPAAPPQDERERNAA